MEFPDAVELGVHVEFGRDKVISGIISGGCIRSAHELGLGARLSYGFRKVSGGFGKPGGNLAP